MERKNDRSKRTSRKPRILQPARKLQKRARQERVEAAVRQHGWSHTLALELANATGWSMATIYRDYQALIARLADQEQAEVPLRRAAVLNDIRALRTQSQREGSFAPAAKLIDLEVKLLGLDRVPLPEVEEPEGPEDTSLEAHLADIRRQRRRAVAGHSYVAAERLLTREYEVLREIKLREEAELAARRAHVSEDDLLVQFREALQALPEAVRRQLQLQFEGKG